MTEFYMHEYLSPIVSYTALVSGFDHSLTSQATSFADESCETNRSLMRTGKVSEGRLGRVLSHCSQPSRKFQLVTCVLGSLVWASAEQWR